ncbi:uncharacterized protein LOC142498885 [Ascaphus truei]|uniref:uncharacterized protein LOC142498885 n=1 Tax=Ascaphus truei TaxID=8439 RepID=UPI003F59EE84
MSAENTCRMSVIFSDVAAHFTEEEWELLEGWQKELYRNVMKEIHGALTALGYAIANPEILFKIKLQEEDFITNHHNPVRKKCRSESNSRDPYVKPDILFQIKHREEPYMKERRSAERPENLSHVVFATGDPVFHPDTSLWVKQVEVPYFNDNQNSKASCTQSLDSLHNQQSTRNAKKQKKLVEPPLYLISPEYTISAPDSVLWIKQEEEAACFSVPEPDTCQSNASTVKADDAERSPCLKQKCVLQAPTPKDCKTEESLSSCMTGPGGTRFRGWPVRTLPLAEDRDCKNTKIVIKTSLSVFKDYLRTRQLLLSQVEEYDKEQLNAVLCQFYVGVRKPSGDYYARKSLISFRYGLQKHFYRLNGMDILHDSTFRNANCTLAAVLAQLKSEGKGEVQHKKPLSKEDFQKLYESCDMNTPSGLQHKVFVDLMLHLCSRGREKLREFSKDEFQICMDSRGLKYVCARRRYAPRYPTVESMADQEPRMYELKGNPRCPVLSFEKYLMKLHPGHSAFWQRPKATAPSHSTSWYCNTPVGKNTLGNYMKTLSHDYGLSKQYTNHCLRVTCNTALLDLCMRSEGYVHHRAALQGRIV